MRNHNYILPVILMFCFLTGNRINAQDIKKEIVVVNPYKPTISDANKINMLPRIKDTVKTVPEFNYKIFPQRMETQFELRPISAAKMVGIPLDKLYKSYIKMGIGNYVTPLLEFSISNLRSKDYLVGADLSHKSSHTNLKLDNNDKVPAGYSKTQINLYGTKFYKNTNLTAGLGLKSDGIRYYGYNTEKFGDSIPDIKRSGITQGYTLFSSRIGIHSTQPDSDKFHYNLKLNYNYFSDKFKHSEQSILFNTSLSQLVSSFMAGIDFNFHYYQPSASIDSFSNKVLTVNPSISKQTDLWKFTLGLNTNTEVSGQSTLYIYPKAMLEFNVVKNVVIPFFGVEGYLEENPYQKIADENLFVRPGINVRNSNHKFIGYGGLKGKLSPNATFRLDVNYSQTDNMYLFVNDTNTLYENTFDVVYDNVDLIRYHGEVSIDALSNLSFLLQGNYYKYSTSNELKAWHKPQYDFTFSTAYNFHEKIYVNLDLIGIGKRYAKDALQASGYKELKGFLDANLGVEYRYSGILSGFIHFYNFTSTKYYIWNQYPSQRFNVMLGFTYKL